MPRIRTIKPEFPQSESMGNVSRDARLTFIQTWTVADDEGRLRGDSRLLARTLYPYDEDALELIDDWLDELERAACVIRYQAGRMHYLQILNWRDHQKIDHPAPSRIPAPTDADLARSRTLAEAAETNSRGPRESSRGPREDLASASRAPRESSRGPASPPRARARNGLDWIGLEGIGEERNGGDQTPGARSAHLAPAPTRKRAPAPTRVREGGFDPLALALPSWLPRDCWESWCEHRRDIRKRITARGAAGTLKILTRMHAEGIDPRTAIENSIANDYQGVVAPRQARGPPASQDELRARNRATAQAWADDMRARTASGTDSPEDDPP